MICLKRFLIAKMHKKDTVDQRAHEVHVTFCGSWKPHIDRLGVSNYLAILRTRPQKKPSWFGLFARSCAR